MKRLLPLVTLLLAGCATVPPEVSSREYLASLTKNASPIRRECKVGERSVILTAYGWAYFLPSPMQDELAKVMKYREASGQWPELTELAARGERWRVSRMEDLLVLARETVAQEPYPELFVAPDGFIGLDAAYTKLLQMTDLAYLIGDLTSRPPPSPPSSRYIPPLFVPQRH